MEPMHNPMCDSLTLNRKCDCGLDVMKARIAELEARLERAKKSVELHDFFTTYDILHEPTQA